mgnify:CR=1 FL=1
MSIVDTALERYSTLSRAMQWAVIAAIGLVLFVIWDTGIRPVADSWNQSADNIQASADKIIQGDQTARWLNNDLNPPHSFGEAAAPSDDAQGREALNRAVNEVIKTYESKVSEKDFSITSGGQLKPGTLSKAAGGRRVSRITGSLSFVSDPETAAAMIAELEMHPEIESIREVRLTKSTDRKVTVRLVIEVWVITPSGSV